MALKQYCLKLSDELREKIKHAAWAEKLSANAWIRRACEERLDRWDIRSIGDVWVEIERRNQDGKD